MSRADLASLKDEDPAMEQGILLPGPWKYPNFCRIMLHPTASVDLVSDDVRDASQEWPSSINQVWFAHQHDDDSIAFIQRLDGNSVGVFVRFIVLAFPYEGTETFVYAGGISRHFEVWIYPGSMPEEVSKI